MCTNTHLRRLLDYMKKEIYFFTGTGNTLQITKEIADNIGGAEIKSISRLRDAKSVETYADIVGIVFPVYFMNVPKIVTEFFGKLKIKEGSYTFLICNCGANYGGTLKLAEKALLKSDNTVSAAYNIYMPDNSIAFPTPLDEHEGMIEKMKEQAGEISQQIKNGIEIDAEGSVISSFFGKTVMENVCTGILGFDKMKLDNEKCTNCGICQKVCPVENISAGEVHPAWGDECQMCFACIHYCAQKAVTYKMQNPQKDYQYKNKYIGISEIINR